MKTLIQSLVFVLGMIGAGTVAAWTMGCDQSDTTCVVTCNNGQTAGTMYWNGSQWSDGIRSSTDRNQLADQMVAAQGTACQ